MWFLDFEAYQPSSGRFIVKEIAILSDDGCRCYNYFVRAPPKDAVQIDNTLYYQFRQHNLRWEFGDYSFTEAMRDIIGKVRGSLVYVKGLEKTLFIAQYFTSVAEIDWVPAFKHLNNFPNEVCDVQHGLQCARRKVHELRHAHIRHLKRIDSGIGDTFS